MNIFKILSLFQLVFLFSSCATREKTLQFQLRLQKIITAPALQEELFKCYNDLLKKKSDAEGHVMIRFTFLSDIRKEISIDEVSPKLNEQSFINCLTQKAEKVDIRPAYSAADSDTLYRGEVIGGYSFKKMPISPKR